MNSFVKPVVTALATVFVMAGASYAQNAFVHGWTLDGASSHLNFITVKKGKVMEASDFATLEGRIDQNGSGAVRLSSGNVGIDRYQS